MTGKGSDKSQSGGSSIKTRHSVGGAAASSRLRSVKAAASTAATRKRYSEPKKFDDVAFTVLERVGTPPTTTSSSSSRSGKMKSSVSKPISPNPSESSACKTVCNSPDLNGETSSAALDALWPALDSRSLQLENRHLKELLVSQLDLIQQQSETILSREKQLKDLRMENEHLRQRLERMERRVRGAEDTAPAQSSTASNSTAPVKEAAPQQPTNPRKRAHPSSSDSSQAAPVIPSKRIKRESEGSSAAVARRVSVESRTATPPVVLPPTVAKVATTPTPTPPPAPSAKPAFETSVESVTVANDNESLVDDFSRFDELTDEIFEESDVRFRISSEDNKSSDSASSCDSMSLSDRSQELAGRSVGGHEPAVKGKGRRLQRKSVDSRVSVQPDSGGRSVSQSSAGSSAQPSAGSKPSATPSIQGALEPMSTSYHYYIGCMNELVNKDDKLTECARLQLGVEVPKFREDTEYDKKMSKIRSWTKRNPYSRHADEVEKLEDATFLKRHEKPEVNEKRTKKWDIQRMREKNYCEKLRARYDASCSKSKKQEAHTLLPTLESAEKILVSRDGKIPVSVFGESVPTLPQSNFILPWLTKSLRSNRGGQDSGCSRKGRPSLQSARQAARQ